MSDIEQRVKKIVVEQLGVAEGDVKNASSFGMTMNMIACPQTNNRQCIYIAWGDTSATNGTGVGDCTQDTSYNNNSTCVIMEAY